MQHLESGTNLKVFYSEFIQLIAKENLFSFWDTNAYLSYCWHKCLLHFWETNVLYSFCRHKSFVWYSLSLSMFLFCLCQEKDPFDEDYSTEFHIGSVKIWMQSMAYMVSRLSHTPGTVDLSYIYTCLSRNVKSFILLLIHILIRLTCLLKIILKVTQFTKFSLNRGKFHSINH